MGTWAEKVFSGLTVEQKVGQVICYRASRWGDETLAMARKGWVGSVAPTYYAGMKDLSAIVSFIAALQEASPVPVLEKQALPVDPATGPVAVIAVRAAERGCHGGAL